MKEAEAKVEYDRHQVLLYVERDSGEYGTLQTGSFLTKNYVDDFWLKRKHLEDDCLNQLKSGKISSVGYYMQLTNISAADLASRIGVSTRKVRKHQTPGAFAHISLDLIRRYAEVFGVPLAQMFQVILPGSPDLKVEFRKTANPFLSITEISGREGA